MPGIDDLGLTFDIWVRLLSASGNLPDINALAEHEFTFTTCNDDTECY